MHGVGWRKGWSLCVFRAAVCGILLAKIRLLQDRDFPQDLDPNFRDAAIVYAELLGGAGGEVDHAPRL